MNYIDQRALRIHRIVHPGDPITSENDLNLYRIYAVLSMSKGVDTSLEDVHDAWAAWTAMYQPGHRSLIPFDELSPEVQALDQPYADAIRMAAQEES